MTNTDQSTLTGVGVSDNKVASVSCPSSTLATAASETCTGTYTVAQADVDAGSVTNTATASGTDPSSVTWTSLPSSVTVLASKATSSLGLVKSTTSTGFSAAGDTIPYNYAVTNTGTTTLSGVGVSDNKIASVSCPDSTLAPGASENCTATYTVTQADVNAGSVTNIATAQATNPHSAVVTSATSSVTVSKTAASSSITLVKSTTSTGYDAAGNTIPYSYAVKNTGNTTLTGVGVSDNKIPSVSCPESTLAAGASETCTATYTVTQADVDAGSVTNTATASGTDPDSNVVSSSPSSVTVLASDATSSLGLVKSTTSTGYTASGQAIPYSYAVTNLGTTTLSEVGVTDNKIASVSCPDSTLAPGASETCTASYTTTQADVTAGSVTNTATAHALNPQSTAVTSVPSSVTVQYVSDVPTITSFTPASGAPGITITITGTNLSGATKVTIGGVVGTIKSDSATVIKVKVPQGALTGKIKITTPGGKVKSATKFTVT